VSKYNKQNEILIKQLDDLAIKFETQGELKYAAVLDEITSLLATAEQPIPTEISNLADVLRTYLPIPPEEALTIARDLFSKYSAGGDEVDGDYGFTTDYFPAGALPHKERQRGPRPEDVPVGDAKWWEK